MIYRETTPAKWSERDMNPRPPDFKSGEATTRPRCLFVGQPSTKVSKAKTAFRQGYMY